MVPMQRQSTGCPPTMRRCTAMRGRIIDAALHSDAAPHVDASSIDGASPIDAVPHIDDATRCDAAPTAADAVSIDATVDTADVSITPTTVPDFGTISNNGADASPLMPLTIANTGTGRATSSSRRMVRPTKPCWAATTQRRRGILTARFSRTAIVSSSEWDARKPAERSADNGIAARSPHQSAVGKAHAAIDGDVQVHTVGGDVFGAEPNLALG